MSRTKSLLAVVAGVLSALSWAVPAQAHNALTSSDPKDGARVASAPRSVTLSFLARLDAASTSVTVTAPGGVAATRGNPDVKGNKVSVGVLPGAAGEYTVAYRVTSLDGHIVKGDIDFTVTTGPSSAPAALPGPSGAPSTLAGDPATPSSTVSSSAVPSATAGERVLAGGERSVAEGGGTRWWPWVAGAVTLLAVSFAGLRLRRRRTAG